MSSGVYQILNKVNGRKYIGSSIDVFNRMKGHKSALIKGEHKYKNGRPSKLQLAWDKYGEEAFVFEPLAFVDPDHRKELEQLLLDELWHEGVLYNTNPRATGGPGWPSRRNTKHKEETKNKMRGKRGPQTKEWIEKRRTALIGSERTEETKQKLSLQNKNRPLLTCPYCNKQSKGASAMKHWHFDNCKHRK